MRALWVVAVIVVLGSAAAADVHASVELVTKDGAPHAIVTTKLACTAPAKCPEWTLDLGRTDTVGLVAMVDLLGEPTRVREAANPSQTALDLPASAKLPAVIVHTLQLDAANTQWERWAVISIDAGKPKLIWRGEIAMKTAKGGGFATTNGVELVATEPGKPLALAYVQNAVPDPTTKPHAAVAAIHRRFVIKDGMYQRE